MDAPEQQRRAVTSRRCMDWMPGVGVLAHRFGPRLELNTTKNSILLAFISPVPSAPLAAVTIVAAAHADSAAPLAASPRRPWSRSDCSKVAASRRWTARLDLTNALLDFLLACDASAAAVCFLDAALAH